MGSRALLWLRAIALAGAVLLMAAASSGMLQGLRVPTIAMPRLPATTERSLGLLKPTIASADNGGEDNSGSDNSDSADNSGSDNSDSDNADNSGSDNADSADNADNSGGGDNSGS